MELSAVSMDERRNSVHIVGETIYRVGYRVRSVTSRRNVKFSFVVTRAVGCLLKVLWMDRIFTFRYKPLIWPSCAAWP